MASFMFSCFHHQQLDFAYPQGYGVPQVGNLCPRATVSTPPPISKWDSRSGFELFAFVRAWLHQGEISGFMPQHSKWISKEVENPNFRPHYSNSH
ncbi:hypothetical protein AVEN_982-1 [Araneus ventricosus]|uniref:Uncharacterized protein n=1 Tax=Araneus ventricosus TaxID=182803 RepID=A0A4Y2CWK5_ARAVE|nr:hypothetical protein AVEN_982-1 [Araneus ventricosus]